MLCFNIWHVLVFINDCGALGLRCCSGEIRLTPIMNLGLSDESLGLGLWGPKCAGPFPLGLVAIPTGDPSK